MKLEWTDRARYNRLELVSYIAQFDKDAARRINETLKASARSLLVFPQKGHTGLIPNTLELYVKPHYRLVYRIKGEAIQILAVLHTAQDHSRLSFD